MFFKKSLQLSRQFCIRNNRQICTKTTKPIIETPAYSLQYGTLKVVLALSSSIYFGSFLAKTGATALEENEIFVHFDEDDDD
uniref:Essential MCU regulator, mitochondrial n=1 Tax=Panagrolaimus sp. JU765 TaxID=591449 RepID=A0AC34QKJ7_9BILA